MKIQKQNELIHRITTGAMMAPKKTSIRASSIAKQQQQIDKLIYPHGTDADDGGRFL